MWILWRVNYISVSVKVTQSCPSLCNSMNYTVHGILQARRLEWVAFPVSRGSSQPRDWTQVSRIAGGFLPAEPPGKPYVSVKLLLKKLSYTSRELISGALWEPREVGWGGRWEGGSRGSGHMYTWGRIVSHRSGVVQYLRSSLTRNWGQRENITEDASTAPVTQATARV